MTRASRLALAVGAAATGLYLGLPPGGPRALLFTAAVVPVPAALALGILRRRPAHPRLWRTVFGAWAVYAAASAWLAFGVVGGGGVDFPSPADALRLASYVVFAGFLAATISFQSATGTLEWIDSIVVAISATAGAWELVLEHMFIDADHSGLARAASVAYPMLTLVVFVLALHLALLPLARSPAHLLLVAWTGLELMGTIAYVSEAHGTSSDGSSWLAFSIPGYAALVAAALHPSVLEAAEARVQRRESSHRSLVVLGVAALLPLVLFATTRGDHGVTELVAFVATMAALIILILVRVSRLTVDLNEQQRLREKAEWLADELQHRAFHDPLTGLPNRALLQDRLRLALSRRVGPGGDRPALMLIDLDGFKAVNDTLGHDRGDELLVWVSRRVVEAVRPSDTVARLGGDEFAVLLDAVEPGEALRVAERVANALNDPVPIHDRDVRAPGSIGVAVADRGDDSRTLLQHADVAMYAAKRRGPGSVEVFAADLHEEVLERHRVATELREAVPGGELVLHYQPVVELAGNRIVGVESLVRWNHPRRGLLGPAEFIPVAEETGLICEVGGWVLREACAQLRRWDERCPTGFRIAVGVNLSPRQLQSASLVDEVLAVVEASDIAPNRVILEVTESALMHDTELMVERLEKLNAHDLQIAIDDFGTGYSSLAYLQRLPASVLKIDKAFVAGIAREREQWALAAAIVNLAKSLDKKTLAEGIELGEQVAHLRALGCDLGQGYLFSRPLPASEIEPLLREQA